MFEFNVLVFSIIVIPYTIFYIKKYNITPVSIFLLMQLNMFYGICLAPRGHSEVAIALESLYPTACLFFILGVQLSRHIKVSNNNLDGVLFEDKDPSKNQMKVIWIIVGVAIVLCTYFFIAGGINVFLRSLGDFFSNTTQNYSSERAQFFSVKGTGYI